MLSPFCVYMPSDSKFIHEEYHCQNSSAKIRGYTGDRTSRESDKWEKEHIYLVVCSSFTFVFLPGSIDRLAVWSDCF